AHAEGFTDDRQKAMEKALLFKETPVLIFAKDALLPALDPEGTDKNIFPHTTQFISWSRQHQAGLQIQKETAVGNGVRLEGLYQGTAHQVTLPFNDRISIDNAITCWAVMLHLGYTDPVIAERMLRLQPLDMRMQLKKALHNCYLLNDSYNNDPDALQLALDYLVQQAGSAHTTVILSDMLQTGRDEAAIYRQVAAQLAARSVKRLIGIGPAISRQAEQLISALPGTVCLFYPDTPFFLQALPGLVFREEYILLKGARTFAFERISAQLEEKVHQTVLEINLSAMAHNLKVYRNMLTPTTKLMVMVKAFSYGSGSGEVARLLQFHRVDYLAVAYTDEGIELRQAGIGLPIMVMNPDQASFEALVNNQLEPEIYSPAIYQSFHHYLEKQGLQQYPVHIKFNTGMNRLGFEVSAAAALAKQLRDNHTMVVKSVFSHLAASDAAEDDAFTAYQVKQLQLACAAFQEILGYPFLRHVANSAAIFRRPDYQLDMVRLGIGLYGVEASGSQKNDLQTVATLKTTIAQLRRVAANETIGYNRRGVLQRDSLIATVRIGYADGFPRSLGLGKAGMYLRGHIAPVIGQVCMDMTMLDVTDVPDVAEGDMVEVFGTHIPVQQVASEGGTIAYEILTGISQRVKRIYLEE
ncbi:MAG TPA: alanine racemase, partial [Sediminibacterium sp.]|nr:alanine racemase [Sediminibacterium sp.]